MTRRFGPTRGAGTVIEEQEGDKGIAPGALGWAGYAGALEKGDVGKLMLISSATDFFNRCGGIISDGYLPDAANDYFQLANGAGGLAIVRVTDGDELQAEATLYARRGTVLTPMGKLLAANGGRWGGKKLRSWATLATSGDLDETTINLPVSIQGSFAKNQLAGGFLELQDVPNTRYPIVANDDTTVTVASDQTMLTDYNALSGSSLVFYLSLDNDGKALSYRIADGEDSPDTEFSIEVFVDGGSVKKWGNLSVDPSSARYWVSQINDDDSNFYVSALDLWTGAYTASVRPANVYGVIASVTETVLTAKIHDFQVSSPGGGNPTFALGSTTDAFLSQTITVSMSGPTTGNVLSDAFPSGSLGTLTLGTAFNPPAATGGANENKWVPPFTVTAGVSPLASGDILTFHYKPFVPDQLIGGKLFPNKVDSKYESYRIIDNDHKTITVAAGSDLTISGAADDEFMVVAAQEMASGRDGNASITDSDYENKAWDVDSSPFNDIVGKGLGLVKFATPGVTSTSVQKAGAAYAEAKNHQYRYEAPANVTTEAGAIALVNDTLGRSDYAVLAFPSWGSVPDPNPAAAREKRLKLVPLVGMIHGREARIATDFDGYHKAEAGIDATLPRLLKIPTGDKKLNEELLNPAGIAVVKKRQGNFIIWGDRTLHRDANWRFKHQREQMSYYEQVLEESFDFIIFAINDAINDKLAETALITFFLPEFTKRALRGKTFQDACIIKVDAELNTDATRAAGDEIASVSLRLADTVERFIIKIGRQGIFENVA